MTLDLCQVNGCWVLVLNHKKLTYFRDMRVFIDMGEKPPKEHCMHLRTHAIMEILNVGFSRNIFSTLW